MDEVSPKCLNISKSLVNIKNKFAVAKVFMFSF